MSGLVCLAALLAPATWASQAASDGSPPPASVSKVDFKGLADQLVNRSVRLAPGEQVALFWTPALDRGMAAALTAVIKDAGGTVDTIAVEAPATGNAADPLARAKQLAEWQKQFAAAQVAIWLPTDDRATSDMPFEKLVAGSRVRSVHFHWILPPEAEDVDRIEALYARAIAVPPARMRARLQKIDAALREQVITVTADNGTNLRLFIPHDAWIHHNTGDASPFKVANARSVRDREEELPASVLRTNDVKGLTGTFVGNVGYDTRTPVVSVTFANGRLTKLKSVRGADAVVAAWDRALGDRDLPAEIVLSANPELTDVLPSGFMPYYGYGEGIVRIVIGDNWENGGPQRTSARYLSIFLPRASLTAGSRVVIDRGKIANEFD